MMNLIIDSRTIYNKYINKNKINNFSIITNYIINYFNRYYPLNVFIHRDISHFIALFYNFFEVIFSSIVTAANNDNDDKL